jgi:membrane glycosyltransferase
MSPPPTVFDAGQLDPGRITQRRVTLATVVLLLTAPAVYLMADLHWRVGFDGWKAAHLALFGMLFTLIAFGAAQAILGFWQRSRRGGDPYRIICSLDAEAADDLPPEAATAVVLPICNEDPSRTLEGLRAIYESIEATGQIETFDFFILSDSGDPNRWIEEESAWVALARQLNARGRIFYRKRKVNTNKKAGNLADFCRRWGKRYRYMVVLDADSIMTGDAVVKLTRMMERNPGVGIIQTVPRLVRGETLFARLQQFASRLYGPIFAAGLNSWQLGESNYWGHNAIIRLAPFIAHCSLPDLPGAEPFGGRILSHDYVEAALMRRGGWAVWLAVDLDGSYEECPANLIDYAKRDRRWSQGNLQHAWLLTAKGLHAANRVHLLMGIMSYLASPLWLAFLVLSTIIVYQFSATGLTLLPSGGLSPSVQIEYGTQALILFCGTLGVLFLPKFLALLDVSRRPEELAAFGGWLRVLPSVILETLIFTLLAPVLMLFHTKFVLLTLRGKGVAWITQRRGQDGEPEWREVILTHAGQTVVGLLWAALAWWIQPAFAVWLSPILCGLVFSIPVSLVTGQVAAGRRFRSIGLFATPEETRPQVVIERLEERLEACRRHVAPLPELAEDHGLLQAVLDPYVNAVHLSMLREKDYTPPGSEERFSELRERLLRDGPAALTRAEKLSLLQDADSLTDLHLQLWSRPTTRLAPWWQLAIRQYNVIAPVPQTALYR